MLVMLSLTILFIVILFVQVNLFVCHRYPIYTWNVLPGKLFRTNHTCSINSLSTQQIFLIILLSLLTCSVDYKYIIIMINNFVNLFLAMIILLTKLTWLRKFLFVHILWNNSTSSCSDLLLHSRGFFFFLINCLFSCAILSIIVLNFSTFNVQEIFIFKIFRKNLERFCIFLYLFPLYLLCGNLKHFPFLYFLLWYLH